MQDHPKEVNHETRPDELCFTHEVACLWWNRVSVCKWPYLFSLLLGYYIHKVGVNMNTADTSGVHVDRWHLWGHNFCPAESCPSTEPARSRLTAVGEGSRKPLVFLEEVCFVPHKLLWRMSQCVETISHLLLIQDLFSFFSLEGWPGLV